MEPGIMQWVNINRTWFLCLSPANGKSMNMTHFDTHTRDVLGLFLFSSSRIQGRKDSVHPHCSTILCPAIYLSLPFINHLFTTTIWLLRIFTNSSPLPRGNPLTGWIHRFPFLPSPNHFNYAFIIIARKTLFVELNAATIRERMTIDLTGWR